MRLLIYWAVTKNDETRRKAKLSKANTDKSGADLRIPITPDLHAKLLHEKNRTGVAAYGLFKVATSPPAGLKPNLVNSWLIGGVASARQDFVEYVLTLWQSLPDNPIIKITPAMRREMKDQARRTGKAPAAMMRGLRPSEIGGLTSTAIGAWMSGKIMTADRGKVEFVLERWRSIPSRDERWMTVSQKQREHLRAEIARTGISHSYFFHGRDDLPAGLTLNLFEHTLSGQTKSIRRHHFYYIIRVLEGMPDRSASQGRNSRTLRLGIEQVGITNDMRDALKNERLRTGVSERALVLLVAAEGKVCPPNPKKINNWINGRTKSAPLEQYEMILAAWRSLPDANAFWDA